MAKFLSFQNRKVSKHCSKINTTSPAEKEERSANKSPSCEINPEDDRKTTILNLSTQILELKQERLSMVAHCCQSKKLKIAKIKK